MGVTGLWSLLSPCARPVSLPSLAQKRLAIDASIWIYQFLKAVRDKEGNALRNSHIVGFFQRICKLLYYGILPVFVFDGAAPALKRMTLEGRRRRREGRRDDAVRTAGKLLAVQMQRRLEEEEEQNRKKKERESAGLQTNNVDEEEEVDESTFVYVDELGMSAQERQKNRIFKKQDAYHLPELNGGIEGMGRPDDPRIMSAEELEEYARQFNSGEDINLYDFSKIDFNGEFFMSLPAGDRYNILNAARLRSRLRMGLSKEQLEEMFPNRMDFSRFQIERVKERNELTQRLMNLNGMNDGLPGVGGGRIAGERGREYVLVKNEGVEGGWALGVVSTEENVGERNKPIDVDALHARRIPKIEESSEDDDFEDVPIEGLNRLPKLKQRPETSGLADEIAEQRRQFYASRKARDAVPSRPRAQSPVEDLGDPESLFVDSNQDINTESRAHDSEEEDLQRAIAMSLRQHEVSQSESENDDLFEDVPPPTFEQRAVQEQNPFTTSRGRGVAHIVNNRANAAVPKRRAESGSSDEEDLQTVLAKSRQNPAKRVKTAPIVQNVKNPWDGPLPFEKLDFRKNPFSKKGASTTTQDQEDDNMDDDLAGGFEKDGDGDAPKPLPPWLVKEGDIRSDYAAQQARDQELNAADREVADEEERRWRKENAPIHVESSDEGSDVEFLNEQPRPPKAPIDLTTESTNVSQIAPKSPIIETADDLALDIRGHPPQDTMADNRQPLPPSKQDEEMPIPDPQSIEPTEVDEEVDWSESEYGDVQIRAVEGSEPETRTAEPENRESETREAERSPSPLFEDISMPDPGAHFPSTGTSLPDTLPITLHASDSAFERAAEQAADVADFDEFSDPDDEELLASMAAEAEENARFQSQFNNKTAEENKADYERELKALRTQQKKDRRDADDVTQTMVQECKALLGFFGLPYITADGEAEAQCAELVRLGLVDGIVTDDCDVFLFGGTRVYKNMFNSNKFVECYLAADIEKEITLGRISLINIAQLLGSDYTEGLPGIGPITALEIISEFPGEDGLKAFRDWWVNAQAHPSEASKLPAKDFKRKFQKTQGKKLFLPPGFPSPAVSDAYLNPRVDHSTEPFQWGIADLNKLRTFLMETIGWGQERVDEVLVPVIRDMNKRATEGTQANITRYFEGGVGVGARDRVEAGRMEGTTGSKRMKEAVGRLKARRLGDPGHLQGTWGEEAREWAKKNELSEEAEKRKQAEREAKKAEKVKENAEKPKRPKKQKLPAGKAMETLVASDDESDEYIESSTKRKGRR